MKKRFICWLLIACAICFSCCSALAETETQPEQTEAEASAQVTEAEAGEPADESASSDEAAQEVSEEAAAEEATAEEVKEEAPQSWLSQAFGEFSEQRWYTLAIVALLFAAGLFVYMQKSAKWTKARGVVLIGSIAVLLVVSVICAIQYILKRIAAGKIEGMGVSVFALAIAVMFVVMLVIVLLQDKKSWNARSIAFAAMCIAVSYILSLISFIRMPQGGSVKLAALIPLVLYALAFGPSKGLLVGAAYGLLKLINDPYIVHPVQMLVDYPMAYAAAALCCLANRIKNDRVKLPVAMVLGYFGKYIMAVLSGVIFFAEYAGEQNAIIYSLGYNITYIWPEALAAVLISLIPGFNRILKAMRASARA
ncbi:MAG: energy-coupled thiamine transporter ThiT [Clostridia bacterium]|nr:energy-coupled thiamine transporter ThiT [Clostridia bacterium]